MIFSSPQPFLSICPFSSFLTLNSFNRDSNELPLPVRISKFRSAPRAFHHPILLQRLRDDLRHLGVALGREVPDGAVGPVDVVLFVDRRQGTALGKGLEQIDKGDLQLRA
jgi:hypothetical protein